MKNNVCLNDFLAVAAVLILALAVFLAPVFTSRGGDYVKISSDSGEQIHSLSDNFDYTVISNGHSVTVRVENGEVSVFDSTCPDKVCVNSGKISRGGEVIICAPALVSVEIVGEKGDVDYAVG